MSEEAKAKIREALVFVRNASHLDLAEEKLKHALTLLETFVEKEEEKVPWMDLRHPRAKAKKQGAAEQPQEEAKPRSGDA